MLMRLRLLNLLQEWLIRNRRSNMKKSNMAIILEVALMDTYDFCSDGGGSYNYEEVLDKLVEAGMLIRWENEDNRD